MDFNSHELRPNLQLSSLDGLNTHDDSYTLSVSGGVTTGTSTRQNRVFTFLTTLLALVLPGSANAIGEALKSNLTNFR